MSEESTKQQHDLSIHPRVVGGRTRHDKVNTAKPYRGGGKLARKQRMLGQRRTAHAASIKELSISATFNPESFRTPGSMKGRS